MESDIVVGFIAFSGKKSDSERPAALGRFGRDSYVNGQRTSVQQHSTATPPGWQRINGSMAPTRVDDVVHLRIDLCVLSDSGGARIRLCPRLVFQPITIRHKTASSKETL